jgi:hypothetical protein
MRKSLWASGLLLVLLARAYVPVGFMPASGAPFMLEICPAGLAQGLAATHLHHHSQGHGNFENCPFGSTPAGGPISHHVDVGGPARVAATIPLALEPVRVGVRGSRAHQPRGPPALV